MKSIYLQSSESLKSWLIENGEKPFRASQIQSWLFKPGVRTFADMKNISSELQAKLAACFSLSTVEIVQTSQSAFAIKLLLKLYDNQTVECVMLSDDREHHTVCLSTQVGCAMGCRFCATGQTKTESGGCFVRNLDADEIIQQVLCFQNILNQADENNSADGNLSSSPSGRITNIVVMGMGEPMFNLDNLLPALDIISQNLEIGARKITISTVGIVEGIERVMQTGKQYHLAISLHAPNDQLRNHIVPANKKTGIEALIQAADRFFEKTGRRITYEYVLLGNTNDSPENAQQLAELLRGKNALVNLIPYNEVPGLPFKRPFENRIEQFTQILGQAGVQVQIRKEKGGNIAAACGQLRRKDLSSVK